ncbi:MAG TPA: WG repeat-containing protein, partial [Chitinophagaceae bacterium]|nr:WG repeat-containing protein [Chitinophagaceae bacterium]
LTIPMIYNSAGYFSEGLAPVSKKMNGRNFAYGFIDKTGKEIIPFEFEIAEEFSEGLAAVKKNGKYGFINKEGKEVIAFKYDGVISGFRNKVAKVMLNGKKIDISITGKEY